MFGHENLLYSEQAVVYRGFRQHERSYIALTTIFQADNLIQRNIWVVLAYRGYIYIYNVTCVGVVSLAIGWNYELCRCLLIERLFQSTNSRTIYIGWNRITIALWWLIVINLIRGLHRANWVPVKTLLKVQALSRRRLQVIYVYYNSPTGYRTVTWILFSLFETILIPVIWNTRRFVYQTSCLNGLHHQWTFFIHSVSE